MPYDEGNECWKVQLINKEGISRGLVIIAEPAYLKEKVPG